jgi:hypothetical protein
MDIHVFRKSYGHACACELLDVIISTMDVNSHGNLVYMRDYEGLMTNSPNNPFNRKEKWW